MPLLGSSTKQPSETELYAISYKKDLDPTDNVIVLSTTITDLEGDITGLPVIETYLADNINQQVKMFISGGIAGKIYKVTIRVQTDTGRILEDEFKLKIKDY